MPSRVTAVILNWNGERKTLACLRSIRAAQFENLSVVLCDNGSRPGSLDDILAEFPDVWLIQNAGNLGFGGGNNPGILHAMEGGADLRMAAEQRR